jgi:hypothetical protein
LFEIQAIKKMGFDIYFQSSDGTMQTPLISMSYSYNAFNHAFNPTFHEGKTGEELQQPLKAAIAKMNRMYHSLTESKDPLKAVPDNYVNFLNLILNYAKSHPTWLFHCE